MISVALTLHLVLAAEPSEAPAVTVVVDGPEAVAEATRQQLEGSTRLPVQLQVARVPTPTPPQPQAANLDLDARLARARQAWVSTDFSKCLAELDAEGARLALGDGRRPLVARWLVWRAACLTSAGRQADAARVAQDFAAWELEPPAELGAVTPDVERLFIETARQLSARPRSVLQVSGPTGAAVSIDGRPGLCSLPCSVNVIAGSHVLRAEPLGFNAVTKWEDVGAAGAKVTLAPDVAPPAVAATQWAGRFNRAPDANSQASLSLLSTALHAHRLVFISAQDGSRQLAGTLAVAGTVAVRLSRDGDAEGLLRDLLVQGSVVEPAPPLYKRPVFWIVVGVVAAAAAATTAVILTRDVQSEVTFR